MKILNVMTTPFTIDGITNIILMNYKNLDKSGNKHDFIFPNKPSMEYIKLFNKYNSNIFVIPGRTNKTFNYIRKFNKVLIKNSYDIIHVHGNSTTLSLELTIAKINNIPVRIAHAHSTYTKYPFFNKLFRPLFNYSYTDGFAVSLKAAKWLFQNNDYYIVENGIDISNYKFNKKIRDQYRKKLGYNDTNFVIGNVGRFSSEKNQKYLIRLLKKMVSYDDRYRLLLVGDGALNSEYKRLVKELELEDYVVFTGRQKKIAPYLFVMDLMIVPSINEGFGLTIIEAQASDLKVMASNNVPREVDATATVDFFELTDIKNLIKSINEYENKIFYRKELILHKKMCDSKFNIEKSVKKLENIYGKLYQNQK